MFPAVSAGTLGLLAVLEVVLRGDDGSATPPVALLLALAATVPLAVVRGHLLAAATVVTAATALTFATPRPPTGAGLTAQLAVCFLLGLRQSRRLRGAAEERHTSRETLESTLLEHVARGERARIARELHDVVAHHISLIAVQAETARFTTPGLPPEGERRLLAIGDTARAALTEMRRLLGVLREDADTAPARHPQPGLGELNELVDEARDASGAPVRLIVHGRVGALDPGVELVAYRIVQEALSNARRHAPGTAVDVELHYAEDALWVRVRDNGPGPADPTGTPGAPTRTRGHGLLGMRERVATVDGDLWTGPAPVSGFLVEVRLPTARSHQPVVAR